MWIYGSCGIEICPLVFTSDGRLRRCPPDAGGWSWSKQVMRASRKDSMERRQSVTVKPSKNSRSQVGFSLLIRWWFMLSSVYCRLLLLSNIVAAMQDCCYSWFTVIFICHWHLSPSIHHCMWMGDHLVIGQTFSSCAGKKSPEDLSILYSNRAASYLKDGNCSECVKDCNMYVLTGLQALLAHMCLSPCWTSLFVSWTCHSALNQFAGCVKLGTDASEMIFQFIHPYLEFIKPVIFYLFFIVPGLGSFLVAGICSGLAATN